MTCLGAAFVVAPIPFFCGVNMGPDNIMPVLGLAFLTLLVGLAVGGVLGLLLGLWIG